MKWLKLCGLFNTKQTWLLIHIYACKVNSRVASEFNIFAVIRRPQRLIFIIALRKFFSVYKIWNFFICRWSTDEFSNLWWKLLQPTKRWIWRKNCKDCREIFRPAVHLRHNKVEKGATEYFPRAFDWVSWVLIDDKSFFNYFLPTTEILWLTVPTTSNSPNSTWATGWWFNHRHETLINLTQMESRSK